SRSARATTRTPSRRSATPTAARARKASRSAPTSPAPARSSGGLRLEPCPQRERKLGRGSALEHRDGLEPGSLGRGKRKREVSSDIFGAVCVGGERDRSSGGAGDLEQASLRVQPTVGLPQASRRDLDRHTLRGALLRDRFVEPGRVVPLNDV